MDMNKQRTKPMRPQKQMKSRPPKVRPPPPQIYMEETKETEEQPNMNRMAEMYLEFMKDGDIAKAIIETSNKFMDDILDDIDGNDDAKITSEAEEDMVEELKVGWDIGYKLLEKAELELNEEFINVVEFMYEYIKFMSDNGDELNSTMRVGFRSNEDKQFYEKLLFIIQYQMRKNEAFNEAILENEDLRNKTTK